MARPPAAIILMDIPRRLNMRITSRRADAIAGKAAASAYGCGV
jgi:hypothetical protein